MALSFPTPCGKSLFLGRQQHQGITYQARALQWWWLQPLSLGLRWLLTCLRALTFSHRVAFGQDGDQPLSERLNLESMTVADSYQGPRMEGKMSLFTDCGLHCMMRQEEWRKGRSAGNRCSQ